MDSPSIYGKEEITKPMSSAGEKIDEELSNIETYDTDDGTVLYDSRNPLAWIKADNITRLKDEL